MKKCGYFIFYCYFENLLVNGRKEFWGCVCVIGYCINISVVDELILNFCGIY